MKKARDRKGRGLFVGFAPEGIERESSRLKMVLFCNCVKIRIEQRSEVTFTEIRAKERKD